MLQLVLEPILGGKVMAARVEGQCGSRTWQFCTATEGLRIVNVGIREGLWGTREAMGICQEICRHLPLETTDLAANLQKCDAIAADKVKAEAHLVEGHVLIALKMSGTLLQNALSPDLCSAMAILDFYCNGIVLHMGDCLWTLQKMLELGVADTIPDKAFHRLTGEFHRSLAAEFRYRQAVSAF